MASGKLSGPVFSLIVVCAIACAAPHSSRAQSEQGSDREREACTPDAFRLCVQAMPDAGRVEECLRRAGPRLSPACYAVFYPPSPGASVQPRGAGERQRLPRQQPMQQLPDDDD